MSAPDDDRRQARHRGFERNQVSDAAFIVTTLIVDDEDIARLRRVDRL